MASTNDIPPPPGFLKPAMFGTVLEEQLQREIALAIGELDLVGVKSININTVLELTRAFRNNFKELVLDKVHN